jgi:uncharacterized membrane protein
MKRNAEIRSAAFEAMQGKWGAALLVTFVSGLLQFFCSHPIFLFLLGNPISVGIAKIYLELVRERREPMVEGIFGAFTKGLYGRSVCGLLLVGIYTFLWLLLLIIPGIIKSFSYALTPYILIDHPELSCNEAIERSMRMMRGHKLQLFLIYLGYLGCCFLSTFTLYIALLWIIPYYNAVLAQFYQAVKESYEEPEVSVE